MKSSQVAPYDVADQRSGKRKQTGSSKVHGSSVQISALWDLWWQPADYAIIKPKDYFSASNELVAVRLAVCWIITTIYDRNQFLEHPVQKVVGHLNPCFGWDYAPASYIAVLFAGVDVFFAIRYATLEAMRTTILSTDGKMSCVERFALVTAYLHGAASVFWLLLWQLGPPDDQWIPHLTIFTMCVLFRYLCSLGNYLEQRFGQEIQQRRVTRRHTCFITCYGCVTGMLPVLYFANVISFMVEGQRRGFASHQLAKGQTEAQWPPLVPWPFLQFFDIAWICCVSTSNIFRVPEPPIQMTRKILHDMEIQADESTGIQEVDNAVQPSDAALR